MRPGGSLRQLAREQHAVVSERAGGSLDHETTRPVARGRRALGVSTGGSYEKPLPGHWEHIDVKFIAPLKGPDLGAGVPCHSTSPGGGRRRP